jgi:hypothetical protein
MSRNSNDESEQSHRAHVYERGKESPQLRELTLRATKQPHDNRTIKPASPASDTPSSLRYPDTSDVVDDWSPEGNTVSHD